MPERDVSMRCLVDIPGENSGKLLQDSKNKAVGEYSRDAADEIAFLSIGDERFNSAILGHDRGCESKH